MGTIEIVGKWDLDENNWVRQPLPCDYGRSLAFGKYKNLINNCYRGVNYIILAHGSRVEDHSNDFTHINESKVGINKIINYFENSNKNVIIKLFLMDADAPIKEDARFLANYVDMLSSNENTDSVNIVGISKGGAMSFNLAKYLKNDLSFKKTNIYTVATPFNGTKLASPKIFYPELKGLISSKIGDNKLADLVYNNLISIYEKTSSNSHMDYDIAMLDGIYEDKLQLYDKSLIENMFSLKNLSSILKINSYKNIVTGIDNKTLKEAFRTLNFTGIGLCILNDLFMDKKSDGMVMTSSQRLVEYKLCRKDFKSQILESSHHDVTSNNRVISDLLHIIDDTINEQYEIGKHMVKK